MKIKIILILFLIPTILFAQKKQILNPVLQNAVQGTWGNNIEAPRYGNWEKWVINGNKLYIYYAHPSDGMWTESHDYNFECVKITETYRSDYDGKMKSETISKCNVFYRDGDEYYSNFEYKVIGGVPYLSGVNNKLWGDDDKLKKRSSNWNPWK
jgi:hypothetical protein